MANISPFDDVSLKGSENGNATIQFHVGDKNLKKNSGYTVDLSGTTLTVSVTVEGTTYKKELRGMEIKPVDKKRDVKIKEHDIEVTVTKTSQFSVEDKI